MDCEDNEYGHPCDDMMSDYKRHVNTDENHLHQIR